MTLKERYKGVIDYFTEARPEAKSELCYGNAFELLVAVILSAQCTDKRVNMVTPALFGVYPDAKAMAGADEEAIFKLIHSVSYPNSKAHYLSATARKLVADFGGEVPESVEELQTLPGVGRKTANVVAAVMYNQAVMPVDTHVFRVANRIGLTRNSKSPRHTEEVLERHIPKELIPIAHHWLILHGRYVCTARAPKCDTCGISKYCEYYLKSL